MNGDVLTDVKTFLGIAEDNHDFDAELIQHINFALFDLQALGFGTWHRDFGIASGKDRWTDVLVTDAPSMVKTFVGLKVRKSFDPPTSTSQADALNQLIGTAEWRVNSWVESEA